MITVFDTSFLNFALYSHLIILFTKAVLTVPDESFQLTNGKPTRVATSTEAFTATSTKNHGHFGTFHGHQIFCYGHFHGHIWGRNTLKSRNYMFAFVTCAYSLINKAKYQSWVSIPYILYIVGHTSASSASFASSASSANS